MAVARLLELGKTEIGCVSTGNVGTAVASLAAKAGVAAYVFYPSNLERGKARACRALGRRRDPARRQLRPGQPRLPRAGRWPAASSSPTSPCGPFYAEGAKTIAYEVVEQLDWRSPDHFVIPAAGGTLSSRVHKGLGEMETVGMAETAATKIHIAQAEGCSPIATAVLDGSGEIEPQTPAHGRPLARDRRPRRRPAGRRRGDLARRLGGDRHRRRDLRGDRPARRHRGHPHRARRRHDDRRDDEARQRGQAGPDDTVVAVISGNGYKTLDEHPDKPWPSMVACEVEAMEKTLAGLRKTGAGTVTAP